MRGYTIILFCIILLIPDRLKAQENSTGYYTIRIKEQVQADYNNLLDTGTVRNFKGFNKYYKWTVAVTKICDSILILQLRPDSLLENGVQLPGCSNWLHFSFRAGIDQPSGAALYTDNEVTAPLMNLVKILVSNIPFVLRIKFPGHEPYVDGIFKSDYSVKSKEGSEVFLSKKKEAIYPPGINLFRNSIDSFSAGFIYDEGSGLLKRGFCFEEKKQKMGTRILSFIKMAIEIAPAGNYVIPAPAVAESFSEAYAKQVPIFSKKNYVERIRRQSLKYEPIVSVRVIVQAADITKEAAGELTSRIRASLLSNKTVHSDVKRVLDSLETSSPWFFILEDALVESGTSSSQDLLADLLQRKGENELFYKRLLVKTGVTAPIVSKKLLGAMIKIKRDTIRTSLSSVAGLALANNAFLMIDEDMLQQRRRVLAELENSFKDSEHQRKDTIQWLQESGNSANEMILPLVNDCFSQLDKDVREEALYTLRFIPGSEVDSLIVMQFPAAITDFPATLTDVLKMRYPSAAIRHVFYKYLESGKPLHIENIKELIDYFLSWKDEVKVIPDELLNIDLKENELIAYLEEKIKYR